MFASNEFVEDPFGVYRFYLKRLLSAGGGSQGRVYEAVSAEIDLNEQHPGVPLARFDKPNIVLKVIGSDRRAPMSPDEPAPDIGLRRELRDRHREFDEWRRPIETYNVVDQTMPSWDKMIEVANAQVRANPAWAETVDNTAGEALIAHLVEQFLGQRFCGSSSACPLYFFIVDDIGYIVYQNQNEVDLHRYLRDSHRPAVDALASAFQSVGAADVDDLINRALSDARAKETLEKLRPTILALRSRTDALIANAIGVVSAINRVGIFHGDVKPANLMIGARENVRLIDFGISCVIPNMNISPEVREIIQCRDKYVTTTIVQDPLGTLLRVPKNASDDGREFFYRRMEAFAVAMTIVYIDLPPHTLGKFGATALAHIVVNNSRELTAQMDGEPFTKEQIKVLQETLNPWLLHGESGSQFRVSQTIDRPAVQMALATLAARNFTALQVTVVRDFLNRPTVERLLQAQLGNSHTSSI